MGTICTVCVCKCFPAQSESRELNTTDDPAKGLLGPCDYLSRYCHPVVKNPDLRSAPAQNWLRRGGGHISPIARKLAPYYGSHRLIFSVLYPTFPCRRGRLYFPLSRWCLSRTSEGCLCGLFLDMILYLSLEKHSFTFFAILLFWHLI